jgi:uncharacterized protein YdeI (YjbR/CyaY-like superfamily)
MGTRDPRVDAYIDNSAEFAKPILHYVRDTVHAACPDVEEAIKWSMPHFSYKGLFCHMAAFKQHCAFGFFQSEKVLGTPRSAGAMGSFGRVTAVGDLPPKKTLIGYLRKAKALKDEGAATPRRRARPAPKLPADLAAALKQNAKARSMFDAFSPSHKREYIEWITDAKTDQTRDRRLQSAVAMIAEGKPRNWKYMGRRA